MAQFTTRLNLRKPGGGSTGLNLPAEPVDIDQINANMDTLDAAVGATICTSTTRPASPYGGQTIYETDTKNTYVRSGASWVATRGPALFGTYGGGASMVGANYLAPGTPLLYNMGNMVIITGTGGTVEFDFPTAFPNGLLFLGAFNGDPATRPGAYLAVATPAAGLSLSHAKFNCYDFNGALAAGGAIRFTYLAIGW